MSNQCFFFYKPYYCHYIPDMKKVLLLIPVCMLMHLVSVNAQAVSVTPQQEEIRDLEMKWMTAVAKKDRAYLEDVLGEQFELSKIGGRAATNIQRKQWIDNYMKMKWGKFEFHAMQITIDSNLAYVNTDLSFKLKPYPFRLSSGVLDIWRKTDGKWKVEKRYLSEDNLSNWLQILEGIAIGMVLLALYRWIRSFFFVAEEKKKHHR